MSKPMIRPVSPFAVATIAPIPLLVLGGIFGGIFIFLALLYMTALTMGLDRLIRTAGPRAAPGAEWPAAENLSLGLAAAHFPLLLIGIAAVTGITNIGFFGGLAALLSFGMFFGQVSNSNAHELIHKTDKLSFNAGKWVLISLLFGHHVTAHLRIHHRYVGTPDDPNTAVLGESFWAFAPRAWGESFAAGWEIENSMAEASGKPLPIFKHPYLEYVAGSIGIMFLSMLIFGFSGLIAYLMLALYAQMQLLLSDYVQHYGLRRRKTGDDSYEKVAPWHSWNSAHWFSSGLMLNAPRHSDHHVNPARPFPELALPDEVEGPRLPHSLPVMAAIAMWPPAWSRMMDHRALSWQKRIDEGTLIQSRPADPMSSAEAGLAPTARLDEADAIADRVNAALTVGNRLDQEPAKPKAAPKPRRAGLRRAKSIVVEHETRGKPRRLGRDGTVIEEAPEAEAETLVAEAPEAAESAVSVLEAAVAETVSSEAAFTPKDEGNLTPQGGETPSSSDLWRVLADDETSSDEPAPAALVEDLVTSEIEAANELEEDEEFVRSSALFSDEETQTDDLTSVLGTVGAEPSEDDGEVYVNGKDTSEKEDLPLVEDAIAGVMADVRKAERRKRVEKFPALEPADDDTPPEVVSKKARPSTRSLTRGVNLAARGLAAVLRGAPPA